LRQLDIPLLGEQKPTIVKFGHLVRDV
jgi:hypothetical protein